MTLSNSRPGFRNDEQRRRACCALVSSQGLDSFWTLESGPTEKALEALRAPPSEQQDEGQRALLFLAGAVWKNEPWLLEDVLNDGLNVDQIVLIMTLAIALKHSPDLIDIWITHCERRGKP